MTNVQLKEVQKMAELVGSADNARKELKRIQSVKCRLKKQKNRDDYNEKMAEVVAQEQLLKEVRDYFEPKKPTVTSMTWEQICQLNYDETVKAIKSIQSKKCNSQWLTENLEDNVEYQNALKIEKMLKKHKETVKPVEETVVKKSEIDSLIDHLENQESELSKEYVLELLKKVKG